MTMNRVMALGTAQVESAWGETPASWLTVSALRVQLLGLGPTLLFDRTLDVGGVPHIPTSNSDKKASTSTLRQSERNGRS